MLRNRLAHTSFSCNSVSRSGCLVFHGLNPNFKKNVFRKCKKTPVAQNELGKYFFDQKLYSSFSLLSGQSDKEVSKFPYLALLVLCCQN